MMIAYNNVAKWNETYERKHKQNYNIRPVTTIGNHYALLLK